MLPNDGFVFILDPSNAITQSKQFPRNNRAKRFCE